MKFIAAVLMGLLVSGIAAAAPPHKVPAAPQSTSVELDRGCTDGKDNRASELCAQWAAVDAAREAVKTANTANAMARSASNATWWGIIFSGASIALLIITFSVTRDGTAAAVKSAEAAMAALEAERAMVELIDSTARMTLSLFPTGKIDYAGLAFNTRWKNLGRNVALETEIDAVLLCFDYEFNRRPREEDEKGVVETELAAGEDIRLTQNLYHTEVEKFLRGAMDIHLRTQVSYRDRLRIDKPYTKTLEFKLVRPDDLKDLSDGKFNMILEPVLPEDHSLQRRFYLWAFPKWPRTYVWIERHWPHLPFSKPKRL